MVRVTGAVPGLTLVCVGCVLGTIAAARSGRLGLTAFLAGEVAGLAAGIAVLDALGGDWLFAATWAGVAVFWAWLWWRQWRRRRKKRSLRSLGEKTRKVFAAMARNMRPGPVLRPAPQGARG